MVSPRATFDTTDDCLTFLVAIPVHEECRDCVETSVFGSETSVFGSETNVFGSETRTKSSERKNVSSEKTSKSSERIIDLMKNKPRISAVEIAMKIDMLS